jgi:hypothetical protein
MFGKVVQSLCRARLGLSVIAGAVGVLTGVEHLFSTRPAKPVGIAPVPVYKVPAPTPLPNRALTKSHLKITQTKSELGYVYWVVREFGANPSYALFDTWQEAMNEVTRRMNAAAVISESRVDSVLIPA